MVIMQDDFNFLRAKYVSRAKFNIGNVDFECWEGEWMVKVNGEYIDTFTFKMYERQELKELLEGWGMDVSHIVTV
jgi:hypothetical protein